MNLSKLKNIFNLQKPLKQKEEHQMVELGSTVKDTISGFTGIAAGRATFMFGCARILIEPFEMNDGKPIEAYWFDEQRVVVVEKKDVVVSPDSSAESGGPQKDPKRSSAKP